MALPLSDGATPLAVRTPLALMVMVPPARMANLPNDRSAVLLTATGAITVALALPTAAKACPLRSKAHQAHAVRAARWGIRLKPPRMFIRKRPVQGHERHGHVVPTPRFRQDALFMLADLDICARCCVFRHNLRV
jgi:hypothetical protein